MNINNLKELNSPIPKRVFPSINNYNINTSLSTCSEPIISLTKNGFFVDSQYYNQGIPGAYKDCYARESVVENLRLAQSFLPDGISFKIYDAYRPICIQQRLWDFYRRDIKNKNPDLSEEEIDFKTSFFVSKPSYDINRPSLHNTGGAIDLTLVDKKGKELNMGTAFDDFSDKAWTNHFEEYADDEEIRNNRRILYNAMIQAGFTNLPSEWWHYDYGTKFWAYFNNTDALYQGVLDIDFPNRFPLR